MEPYYDPVPTLSYVTIAGWGSSRIEDVSGSILKASMSNVLNYIEVRVRGSTYCRGFFNYGNFKDYQICTELLSENDKTNWVISIRSCVSAYLLNPK